MAEESPIAASDLFSGDSSELFLDAGIPKYNRRLTDKVLAAFNHAYSVGADELARQLWEGLQEAEKLSVRENSRRRPNQALEQASMWVAFVDARDRYREMAETLGTDAPDTIQAYQAMRVAYTEWIEGAGEN